ncbi:MAG: hypothetical protein ACXAC7_19725 [Candidatus Hodarchaeales archaeon]
MNEITNAKNHSPIDLESIQNEVISNMLQKIDKETYYGRIIDVKKIKLIFAFQTPSLDKKEFIYELLQSSDQDTRFLAYMTAMSLITKLGNELSPKEHKSFQKAIQPIIKEFY